MRNAFKKCMASVLVLSMVAGSTVSVCAAAPEQAELNDSNCITAEALSDWAENLKIRLFNRSEYAKYKPGVTVEKDSSSPTGYTATFILKEETVYTAKDGTTIDTAADPLEKVELYSDCFMLFDPANEATGSIDPALGVTPYQYQAGMAGAGGNGDTTCYIEMEQYADGRWGVQVPLSSGAFVYNFRVTGKSGTQIARIDDPSNPTLINEATGITSLSSMVYIPYDADKMGTGTWANRSVELPAVKKNQGTVETISYVGADGTEHGLAVYLPADYDADRAEPYKVLYLSHGASGDTYGNELRWMNEGAVANMMDNLIAEGKTESFVVVTMNNQQFGWKYSDIETDQIDYIMPCIESKYNVYNTAEGRAYAGLSMGGLTTSNMLINHSELFDYYGIWSYANASGVKDEDVQQKLLARKDSLHIMTAAGAWDFGRSPVRSIGANLAEIGIESSYLEVPAAHDWECWQLIFANAAENFFWK